MLPVLPFLALLLILVLPSSNTQIWNGLPLSTWPEAFGLAVLVPFFFSTKLRSMVSDGLARIRVPSWVIYVPIALIFVGKLALLFSGVEDGFSGCYWSPAPPTAASASMGIPTGCERSYEDLWQRSGETRIDRQIIFGQDGWNLVFLNSTRYDYYDWEPGNIFRDRIPLEVHWTGSVDVKEKSQIRIQYAGSGRISIGDISQDLPGSYDQVQEASVNVPPGKYSFSLQYFFDDQSRSGIDESTLGPRPQIKVLLVNSRGENPLRASLSSGWSTLAFFDDAVLFVLLSCLALAILCGCRKDWLPLIGIGLLVGITLFWRPNSYIREGVLIGGLLAYFLWHWFRQRQSALSIFLAVLIISFGIVRIWLPATAQVLLRSAGNDPLAYDSQAYSILALGSLRGGESVFYYQPLFRYWIFVEHSIFGDGNALPTIMQLSLFLGGAFFLATKAMSSGIRQWRRLLIAVLGMGILFLGGYYVSTVIRDGLSEYVTWILLLFALPFLFINPTLVTFFAGSAFLALSYVTRNNQLPAILWIFAWAVFWQWKRNRTVVFAGLAVVLCIFLLPLAHNLYYGHVFELGAINHTALVDFPAPPSTWLAFFHGDPSAGVAVRDQMSQLFLLWDVPKSKLPTMAGMALFLFIWTGVSMYAVVRRKIKILPILAIPLMYLAPHFFYVINTYYPRHIVIGYLSMAVVVIIALIKEEEVEPVPVITPPAVESSRNRSNGEPA